MKPPVTYLCPSGPAAAAAHHLPFGIGRSRSRSRSVKRPVVQQCDHGDVDVWGWATLNRQRRQPSHMLSFCGPFDPFPAGSDELQDLRVSKGKYALPTHGISPIVHRKARSATGKATYHNYIIHAHAHLQWIPGALSVRAAYLREQTPARINPVMRSWSTGT